MSRILAQVLVAGATVLARAATQAWAQALANAQKSGVAQEAVRKGTKSIGSITTEEARMILQVQPEAAWGEVVKRYKHLFEVNEKQGSFYLQSKVFRAKERLEQEYAAQGIPTDIPEDNPGSNGNSSTASSQQQQQLKGKPE